MLSPTTKRFQLPWNNTSKEAWARLGSRLPIKRPWRLPTNTRLNEKPKGLIRQRFTRHLRRIKYFRRSEPLKFDVDRLVEALLAKEGKAKGKSVKETHELVWGVEATMDIITGAAVASAMVGMVHFAKTDELSNKQNGSNVKAGFESKFTADALAGGAGYGAGGGADIARTSKGLDSNSEIIGNAFIYAIGALPSIKSNSVGQMVKYLDTDPKKNEFAVGCARFGRWGPNDVNERHAKQIDDEHNDGL